MNLFHAVGFVVVVLYSCLCILSYHYYYYYYNENISTIAKSALSSFFGAEKLSPGQGKYKKRNEEWEQLNKNVFFRRTAAFYIVNHSLLRFFMLKKSNTTDDLALFVELLVEYKQRTYNLTVNNYVSLNHMAHRYFYEFFTLEVDNFDLIGELRANYNLTLDVSHGSIQKEFSIKAFISDSDVRTLYPLDVQVKQWQENSKQGAIICSDCYFYGDGKLPINYEQFVWWIETSRRFGYKKLVICNTSIPNSRPYIDLFAKHKDFIELYDLKHFPNFVYDHNESTSTSHVYFNKFEQLNANYSMEIELFQIFNFNECLTRNIDRYQRVAVNDVDELIIPRASTRFVRDSDGYDFLSNLDLKNVNDKQSLVKLLALEHTCMRNSSPIEHHIRHLEHVGNTTTTFYFKMGHHLNNVSTQVILKGFAEYFASDAFKNASIDGHHVVKLSDMSEYGPIDYYVHLNGERDVVYMQNMLKIHKLLISDFATRHKHALSNMSQFNHFDRFLYLNGNLTDNLDGKSIHNTDVTVITSIHQHTLLRDGFETLKVAINEGHCSHFRKQINFYDANTMTIRDLNFDFNYLYCYYRDVLKELTSLDIILD